MTENAVLQLRAERIARATRPFLARGNRVRRCQRCLLPEKLCLCSTITPAQAKSRFCLLMFDTEPMKPSNTGRLIADILPDTVAFQWSRTEPSLDLLDLVQNPDYQPMVVFPASYADEQREVIFTPPAGKPRYLSCSMVPGRKLARCFVKVRIWIIFPSFPSIFPGFLPIACVKPG